MTSTNPIDRALFRADAIAPETLAFAENLRQQTASRPPGASTAITRARGDLGG